jgi:arabinan endo-1,5-alpha-L-arabinosidase
MVSNARMQASNLWAPDVRRVPGAHGGSVGGGGGWRLYYAASSFGSQRSCIGLATAPHLQTASGGPALWSDRGPVLCSAGQMDESVPPCPRAPSPAACNAIDPHAFFDEQGGAWLVFGSFWSGIKLVALDPRTGMLAPQAAVTAVAENLSDDQRSIEAAWIQWDDHTGFYFLFVRARHPCSSIACFIEGD